MTEPGYRPISDPSKRELTPEERARKEAELTQLIEVFEDRVKNNKLQEYSPGRTLSPTAKQQEFHTIGARENVYERCLMAANQSGKSLSAAAEVAMHMTGLYPDWWEGHRFKGPIKLWAAGVTGESTRDNPQRHLLGQKRMWGTGMIPRETLIGEPLMARGVPDAVDSFQVEHASGGTSICWFKSYEKGREKWQGETLDLIWYDEEPPKDIYEEGQTRLVRRGGISFLTFTPLLGMTEVVRRFYEPEDDDLGAKYRVLVHMDLDDAEFYSESEKERIRAGWDEISRRTRAEGLPAFGEGLVYPVADEQITCEPFEIPRHYRRIVGFDFGVQHPMAQVYLAWNPDTDVLYVYDTYKRTAPEFALHAKAAKDRGADKWPVAWPHDGLKRDPKSATPIKDHYRREGINMLPLSARFRDDEGGAQSVSAGVSMLLDRMQTGRFKVFSTCRDWFREKGAYHYKEGKIVDYMDDLLDATRIAAMMLRHAKPDMQEVRQTVAHSDYDPLQSPWDTD